MKPTKTKSYYLYKYAYWLLAHLPWFVIEGISHIITALLYSIIRYRRRVVRENLSRSFPEKSSLELRELEWDFYNHLVHQFISSPKILYQNPETIVNKHLKLIGSEQLGEDAKSGAKAIILLMGHCGNWEVFTAANLYLKPQGVQAEQLYRPLSNQALDAVQLELRSRFGAITTPKAEVARKLIEQIRQPDGMPHAIAFIADQTPSAMHIGLWSQFLGQPTAWLDGAERLARKHALPVYYVDIRRLSNKSYEGEFVCLSSDGSKTEPGEITLAFARHLEHTIKRDPAIWLWSHKRWKHKPASTDVIR